MTSAALHDERHVPALLGQERQILQRIAVDDDEVGEGAGRDAADLAFHAQTRGPHRASRDRMTSCGGSTSPRSRNSSDCMRCSAPRRSVP